MYVAKVMLQYNGYKGDDYNAYKRFLKGQSKSDCMAVKVVILKSVL